MKLKALLLIALALPTLSGAQNWTDKKYLAGAVPQNEQGIVTFSRTYDVPGKSQQEIFALLRDFIDQTVIHGENSLPQARLVENDEEQGLIAARVEEYLYFRRSALVTHRTRLLYDLEINVRDAAFSIEMRRIRYIYEEEETPNNLPQQFTAEEWITDKEALTKKGTLLRKSRNFRVFTLERKDELFRAAAKAAGIAPKTRLVEVDE